MSKIIGFRSKTGWKGILAALYYLFTAYFTVWFFPGFGLPFTVGNVTLYPGTTLSHYIQWFLFVLLLVIPYILVFNIGGIRNKLPLFKSKKPVPVIIGSVILMAIMSGGFALTQFTHLETQQNEAWEQELWLEEQLRADDLGQAAPPDQTNENGASPAENDGTNENPGEAVGNEETDVPENGQGAEPAENGQAQGGDGQPSGEASPASAPISSRLLGKVDDDGNLLVELQVKADEPGMTLINLNYFSFAYDRALLRLIDQDTGNPMDENATTKDTLIQVPYAIAMVHPNMNTPAQWRNSLSGYAARVGNSGYVHASFGHPTIAYPRAADGTLATEFTALVQFKFEFASGKSKADLNSDSIRHLTSVEMEYFAQSAGVALTVGNAEEQASYRSGSQINGKAEPGMDSLEYSIVLER